MVPFSDWDPQLENHSNDTKIGTINPRTVHPPSVVVCVTVTVRPSTLVPQRSLDETSLGVHSDLFYTYTPTTSA